VAVVDADVNAVRMLSVLSTTISGRSSSRARSRVDRGADHARGVVQEEGDLVGRGALGRHDESPSFSRSSSSTTITISPAPDGGDGVFDLGERHQRSFQASRRSTYFTVTSTSRLTASPGWRRPRVGDLEGVGDDGDG
jgi:hypothetical protein